MSDLDAPLPGDDVPELIARSFAASRAKRTAELLSDAPILFNDYQHEWQDDYYGTGCKKCGAWYPFGGAPWDGDEDLDDIPED
jgi:hypothetical protein